MCHPVVLCGGSGTRLWPLSRNDCPKRFSRFPDDRRLFRARTAGVRSDGFAAPDKTTQARRCRCRDSQCARLFRLCSGIEPFRRPSHLHPNNAKSATATNGSVGGRGTAEITLGPPPSEPKLFILESESVPTRKNGPTTLKSQSLEPSVEQVRDSEKPFGKRKPVSLPPAGLKMSLKSGGVIKKAVAFGAPNGIPKSEAPRLPVRSTAYLSTGVSGRDVLRNALPVSVVSLTLPYPSKGQYIEDESNRNSEMGDVTLPRDSKVKRSLHSSMAPNGAA